MDQHIFWIPLISLLFHLVDCITDCTNVYITNHEGIITSPNYPSNYPDFTSCSWYIDIPKNSILSISILDLSIEADVAKDCGSKEESSPCCLRNWLSVPVPAKPAHKSRLLCGSHPVQSFDLPDSLKIASVKFHSSKNVKGGRGFKLKYAIVPTTFHCQEKEFSCLNGHQCIEGVRQCDGIRDCDDQSDENNCALRCLAKGLSSCHNAPHVCYNSSASTCASLFSCPATEDSEWVPCRDDSACIRGDQLCDKTIDCEDQSDEANCKAEGSATNQDADVFFMCDIGKWVRSSKVCDGNDDCGDHSDEDGCVRPSLETAIILGCLSCSLLFILLASYVVHAHQQHLRGSRHPSPPLRPMLNIHNQPYVMPFREPPPPYPLDPPPNRRRYRRHRRHSRLSGSPAPASPQPQVPLEESVEPPPQEHADVCGGKAPEEHQEGAASTE